VDDLDKNPRLLNVENGTVDLKTGELLPHRKEDMITKLAKVRCNREAGCPMWKQFVREIMDYKADLIAFLQTAAGWGHFELKSARTVHVCFMRNRGQREEHVSQRHSKHFGGLRAVHLGQNFHEA
jgi:putative DNA primase/helicase